MWFALMGSLFLNLLLFMSRDSKAPTAGELDARLMGSWASSDPKGYLLIMMYTGEFVLVKNGRSEWPVGRWSAVNGNLSLFWDVDDDTRLFKFGKQQQTAKYTVSADGNQLTIDSSPLDLSPENIFRRVKGPS